MASVKSLVNSEHTEAMRWQIRPKRPISAHAHCHTQLAIFLQPLNKHSHFHIIRALIFSSFLIFWMIFYLPIYGQFLVYIWHFMVIVTHTAVDTLSLHICTLICAYISIILCLYTTGKMVLFCCGDKQQ